MDDAEKILQELEKLSKQVYQLRDQCGAELSQADRTITDIYHYIENKDLNAADGYKAYKMLQTALRTRRNIKLKIERLTQLKAEQVATMKDGRARQRWNNQATQWTYKPRALPELFVPQTKGGIDQ